MPEKTPAVYAKGLYFNKNHPDTPDAVKEWKKGSVAVHIDNFIEQLTGLKGKADQKGYIRFDLTLNEKNGEKFFSFKLNDWTPPVKTDSSEEAARKENLQDEIDKRVPQQVPAGEQPPADTEIDESSIPF